MNRFLLPSAILGLALPTLAATITVTTTSNVVDPDDGETSLVEALQALQDGDTIGFAIPGVGPHYIETPLGGYPAITKSDVTIDGYTQPGSKKNSKVPTDVNDALLKIVLDSRNGNRKVLAEYEDDDFGDSEAAILYVVDAVNVAFRGLAFLSTPGNDSDLDPNVYDIAYIRSSADGKIQGCWFGLDPAAAPYTPDANGVRPGIYPSSSAIASFGKQSGFMTIGASSSTSAAARAESNIFIGHRISVHLEQPDVKVSANRFNVLPNGEMFHPTAQWQTANPDYYDSLESPIQNGHALNMIIGADGDNIADVNERNIFGPINYECYMEFWREGATGIRIGGNRFGVDGKDNPAFDNSEVADPVSLIVIRANSTALIGSDYDGKSDSNERNIINGLTGPLIRWHSSNSRNDRTPARVSLRGNNLSNNLGMMPYDPNGGASADTVFRDILEPSAVAEGFIAPRWSYDPSTKTISGEVPPTLAGVTDGNPILDVYIGDGPTSAPHGAPYESGFPQGRLLCARLVVDGPKDLDSEPGKFKFALKDFESDPSATQFAHRVVTTANWLLLNGDRVTSNFSPVLEQEAFGELKITSVKVTGSGNSKNVKIDWEGGYYPFRVEYAPNPWGPWATTPPGQIFVDMGELNARTLSTIEVRSKQRYFYRVRDNVNPSPPAKLAPGGPIGL